MYYCFGCGAGGNVISFVMEYENYTFCGGREDAGGPRRDRIAGDGIFEGSKGPGKLKKIRSWRSTALLQISFITS